MDKREKQKIDSIDIVTFCFSALIIIFILARLGII